MSENLSKIVLGIGCVLAAPVVALAVVEAAAVVGVASVALGVAEAAAVSAGVSAAVTAEKAVTTIGLAKIAEGVKKI